MMGVKQSLLHGVNLAPLENVGDGSHVGATNNSRFLYDQNMNGLNMFEPVVNKIEPLTQTKKHSPAVVVLTKVALEDLLTVVQEFPAQVVTFLVFSCRRGSKVVT